MNQRKLSIFKGVVDAKSFSGAAASLCISQPAVSKAIKDLESELSCILLSRNGNKAAVTRAGETLYAHAAAMIELERSLLSELKRQRGLEEGELIIGATRNVGTFFVPPLIARFVDQFPAIETHLASDNPEAIERRLRTFELDVAFLESELSDPQIDCQYWRDDSLVILACAESELARQQAVNARDLAAQTWILSEANSGLREQSEKLLREADIRPSKIMEVEGSGTIIQCVATGLGVALVSERAAREHLMAGHVAIVDFPVTFHRPLFLATLRKKPTSPTAAAFLDIAKKAVQ